MYQPLADLLRPQTLDDVVGQEHILGEGAVLRRLIQSGNIPNMVFYGPTPVTPTACHPLPGEGFIFIPAARADRSAPFYATRASRG